MLIWRHARAVGWSQGIEFRVGHVVGQYWSGK